MWTGFFLEILSEEVKSTYNTSQNDTQHTFSIRIFSFRL